MSGAKKGIIAGSVCLVIILIVLAALIGASFSYIEYDEIAFKKNSVQNQVDGTIVYASGRYMWGPGFSAVKFPRTYQQLALDSLFCFTQSGIEIELNITLQWRFTAALLPLTYAQYGTELESKVKTAAESAIKNTASNFETGQYFSDRATIGRAFYDAASIAIADLYLELGYLQLLEAELTNEDQVQRYLDAANQIQSNEREEFVQNSTLIRANTSVAQGEVLAEISVILADAAAEVQIILEKAKAEAKRIETEARKAALSSLFTSLGLNTSELKLNYLYITSLGDRATSGLKTEFLANLPINVLSLAT